MLVAVPAPVAQDVERDLSATAAGRACRVLRVDVAPEPLPEGLLVLWDHGGPLEAVKARCQGMHARRVPSRTWLVVLTSRDGAEAEALVEAGADECVAPPGTRWGPRLAALLRRSADEDALALRRTRDMLQGALDAVPEPLFIKNREHRFVVTNSAFCRLLGQPAEALRNQSSYAIVPAHEAELSWRQDERAFTTGQTVEDEVTFTDLRGRSFEVITQRAAYAVPSGERFLVGLLRDVTERTRLETQRRLAERMTSVGTLAAGVAHEINNPLSYVTSNLAYLWERVAQPVVPVEQLEELRQVVAEALEGAGRVRSIVRDLRTFSRAEEESHGPVDVQRAVDGALKLMRDEVQHRARLTCELEPVAAVHGNEGRLGQVVTHLLMNALQAFGDRPVEENAVRVRVRPGREGHVLIEVEDNGQGMAMEVRQRIFDPFFTTRAPRGGTGLGLSICLTLVHAMGGHIEVASEQGQGSLFRVELPALAAQAEVAVPPAEAAPVAAPTTVAAPAQATRATRNLKRLLLIDDEPAVGSAVSRLLRNLYEVHVIQDAREALKRLSHGERFDAILCDLMMPGMSGMDFLVELERLAPELAPRTGLMTGGVNPQAREFVGRRAKELLEKPFERDQLCTFVETLMQ
ncbi:hybrid sensor histidine kinase/response regulator [Corallococcus sp. CA053C]|uniref:hybrid sensor histidine kinase/response regulator n=1 Tax=Corallococcus sp. CA053C TaxID=2316732 RepID=UPI000EA02923|nr:hybrid sensor histidine kinase/response regulator [Corallococcus sp. CA053C]RKH08642.1 hybrid sensor histidine kinase/response regulator [Corallococcus sp. CA053C]